MGLIEFVEIKGYGPHIDTYVPITGDLVGIRGPNQAGKSFFIDAIEICLMGGAIGANDYTRGLKKQGYIRVGLSGGKIVTRGWKGNNGYYDLEEVGKPTIHMDKVSDAEAIQEFTGFKPVIINKAEKKAKNTLFKPLGSPPFELASCSPEVVYRIVSSITSSASIANAKVLLSKELTKITSEREGTYRLAKVTQERIDYLEDSRWKTYASILAKIKEREEALEVSRATLSFLESTLEKINNSCDTQKSGLDDALESLNALTERIELLKVDKQTLGTLTHALARQKQTAKENEIAQRQLDADNEELAQVKSILMNFKCAKCNRIVQVVEDAA